MLEDDRGGVARLQRDLVGALDQRDPVTDKGVAQDVVGVLPSAGRSMSTTTRGISCDLRGRRTRLISTPVQRVVSVEMIRPEASRTVVVVPPADLRVVAVPVIRPLASRNVVCVLSPKEDELAVPMMRPDASRNVSETRPPKAVADDVASMRPEAFRCVVLADELEHCVDEVPTMRPEASRLVAEVDDPRPDPVIDP